MARFPHSVVKAWKASDRAKEKAVEDAQIARNAKKQEEEAVFGDDGTPLNLPIPPVPPLKDGPDIVVRRGEDPLYVAQLMKMHYPQAKELARELVKLLGMNVASVFSK
jgi:hypothetical protein